MEVIPSPTLVINGPIFCLKKISGNTDFRILKNIINLYRILCACVLISGAPAKKEVNYHKTINFLAE